MTSDISPPAKDGNKLQEALDELSSLSETSSIVDSSYANGFAAEHEFKHTREMSEQEDSKKCCECCSFSRSITSLSQDSITSESSSHEPKEAALCGIYKITSSHKLDASCNCFEKNQMNIKASTTQNSLENQDFLEIYREIPTSPLVLGEEIPTSPLFLGDNGSNGILLQSVTNRNLPIKMQSSTIVKHEFDTDSYNPPKSLSDSCFIQESLPAMNQITSECTTSADYLDRQYVSQMTYKSHKDFGLFLNKRNQESFLQFTSSGAVQDFEALDNIVNNFDDYMSLDVNHSFDEQWHYDDDDDDDDEFKYCDQNEADNEDKEEEKDYCEENCAETESTFIDIFYNDSIDSSECKKETKQAYLCNIIDQFQSQNETYTSFHAINSVSQPTCGTNEMLFNATTSFLHHGINHISVPDIYDMLEEMAHIFESNFEFYNAISKDLKSAFEVYFASQAMACEANRNKSGNSGYNLTPTNNGTAAAATKQKNVDLAESSVDNKQNLLACLEKARLVSILHGKIGHMTNRTDNYAAVKAYEKSVTDFEHSMREYMKSSAENCAISELLKHLPSVSFSETPAAEGSQEACHASEHSVLRRSNTFVVEETCTTKPPAKARQRKSCVPSKGEHSGKVKMIDEKIFEENEIDEVTFVVDSESTKDPHSSPTFLVGENPLLSNVESINVSQTFKMNDGPSSSKRCQMSTGFLQMDHECNSDTSDSMSEPRESTNKIYTSTMLAKLLGYIAPSEDKTPDNKAASSDNKEIKKCNEQITSGNSSPISHGHLSSLKKFGINSILDTENEHTCIDQAISKSPENLLLKEKFGIKTDLNTGIEDQKCATDSEKSDSKFGKQFYDQERVIASHSQSSNHCKERLGSHELEPSAKETLKLKYTTNDDLKNASTTKDKLRLDFSAATKKIFSPEKQQIFHNAEENSLNRVRIFKRDTSPVTKPEQNAASSKTAHSKKKKSTIFWEFLGSKSKHTSPAQSSVKSPKKWQLPLAVKESDSQKHSSDTFVSKLDWSSSDEDAVHDHLYDKSPPGILHHTQKDDVKNKLREPNQNSQRGQKLKSSLRKQTSAGGIKNYGNEFKVNEFADVTVKSHSAREQGIEDADYQRKIKGDFLLGKEGEMKVLKTLLTDLNEGTSNEVLPSASQYLHLRAEEECTINEGSLDTIIISQSKVRDHDKMKKSCEETQEIITVCSSTSNTSDEYILPVSHGIVESKSENDIKICGHDNNSFLINADSKHVVLQPNGTKGTRESTAGSYVSGVHTDVNIVAENHSGQNHQNTFSVAEVCFSAAAHSALVNQCDPNKCNSKEVMKPNFCPVERNICFDYQTLNSTASEQLVKEISVTEPKLIQPPYPSNFISLKEEVVLSERNDLIGKKHEIKFSGPNVQIDIDKHNSPECLPSSQQVLETLDLNTVASVMVKNDIKADQMTMNDYGNAIIASAELLQHEAEGILLEKDRPEYRKLHSADLLSKFQTISDLHDKVDQLQRMFHLNYLTSCNFHHGNWVEMNKHPVKHPNFQHQTPVQSIAHRQLCPTEHKKFPLRLCSSLPSTNNDLDKSVLTCNIHSSHLCRQQPCSCQPICDHIADIRPESHQESVARVCQTLQNNDNSKSVQNNTNLQSLTHFSSDKDAIMKSPKDQLTVIHQNLQEIKRFDEHVSQAVRELDERVEQFTEQTTTVLTSQGTCLEQLQVLILEGLKTIQASVSKQEELYHSVTQQVATTEMNSEIKQQSLHYQQLETTMKSEQMVQEALLPLSDALSAQRQELEEVKSNTDRIVSYLEESRQEKERRGMDYDKMKERIVELTSQRDAEKVFHKITRQSLRALERDHERLRQEYVCAACRRYIQGNSDVQKRMWHFLNNHDNTHHYNDNQSNKGEAFWTSSPEGVRQEGRLAKHRRQRKSVKRHPYCQVHGNFPCHEGIPLDCCHFND